MAVENQFSTVRKVLCGQFLIIVLVTGVFFAVGGWSHAFSPFVGGSVALIPNVFFAFKLFLARNMEAQGIVNAFYVGEAMKLILTALLFFLVLHIPSINFLTLLAGYVAVLSVFWFALFYWRE
jgi:ATP synthase protein I